MRPIFHLYRHIALNFNSRPVCDAFLKTLALKSLLISSGNFASKKGKLFGPISNVNFRLECSSEHTEKCHLHISSIILG